jgi:hypothetical protein
MGRGDVGHPCVAENGMHDEKSFERRSNELNGKLTFGYGQK